eukprot:4791580-Lingulodinium_polyedra.AAC.1
MEELEVVVERRWVPMREARKVEDLGSQESQRDEPMADACSIDPADIAFENLGNESSATAATDELVKVPL